MQYIAIIEGDEQSGYSAYVPDLSGCIAAGDPIPPATSCAITVDVNIPVAA